MIILDENILQGQREKLIRWKIKFKHIGYDLSYKGIIDENIIVLLHKFKQATLFTRDSNFFNNKLVHNNYCIVHVNVKPKDVAIFIRKFLKTTLFDSKYKRIGNIIRVSYQGIKWLQLNEKVEKQFLWNENC